MIGDTTVDPTTELYEQKIDYLIRTAFMDQAQAAAPKNQDGVPTLSEREAVLADELGRLVADEMLVKGHTRVLAEQLRRKITHVVPSVMAKHAERLVTLMSPEMEEASRSAGMKFNVD